MLAQLTPPNLAAGFIYVVFIYVIFKYLNIYIFIYMTYLYMSYLNMYIYIYTMSMLIRCSGPPPKQTALVHWCDPVLCQKWN